MDRSPVFHVADAAIASGATREQSMLSSYILTHRVLLEVVEQAGGEVRLPAGIQDRVANDDESLTIATRFDEETGEYIVRVMPTPDGFKSSGDGPGVKQGDRWRQERDPDRPESAPYRVDCIAGDTATLVGEVTGIEIRVKKRTLLLGLDGWRRV